MRISLANLRLDFRLTGGKLFFDNYILTLLDGDMGSRIFKGQRHDTEIAQINLMDAGETFDNFQPGL